MDDLHKIAAAASAVPSKRSNTVARTGTFRLLTAGKGTSCRLEHADWRIADTEK